MSRWAGETDFMPMVSAASIQYGVDPDLIMAIIGQESGFNPKAFRAEPAPYIGSYGLMQLLPSTAQQFGFTSGNNDDLFMPWTNVLVGTAYLASLIKKLPDLPSAISAYNGGIRPDLGFGARARVTQRVCLAKDPKGQCTQWRTVAVGEFANQPYVNNVLANLSYFQGNPPVAPPTPTLPGALPSGGGIPAGPVAIAGGLTVALIAAAAYFLSKGR